MTDRWSLPLDFGSPWFLLGLLLVPLVTWWARRSLAGISGSRRVVSIVLRTIVVLLIVLALAELRILQRNDRLAVIFLLDRSESIPGEQKVAALEYTIEAAATRDEIKEDLVGVIAFGKVAGIEVSPRKEPLELQSFTTLIEPEATNLAAAIRLAVAAFPEGVGRRIVILSDGNENRESSVDEVRTARSLGVTVDVVPINYKYPTEISVEKILVDPEAHIGQPFDIPVVVDSTAGTEVEAMLRLFENDVHVPYGDPKVKLHPGKNVFKFPGRRLDSPGRYLYEARIEPLRSEDDAVIQNNTAYGFTLIEGEPTVLFCAKEMELDEPLISALRAERIAVKTIAPDFLPRLIEEYFDYQAIILSNVGAHEISDDQMKIFESLVKDVGIGFVMIGGEDSFGAGGYQGTPVERLLPVDMEITQRKVLPNGALAMVVHSCELGNGNQWAIRVIQRAIRILSPRDYAGVLYHDDMSGEKWLFPMLQITQRQMMLSRLSRFNPGDMLSFQQIMQMALTGLANTKATIMHMIVLSDGDPQMPTSSLVQQIRAAGITVSTICYGAHGTLPPGMQQLAQDGRGKFYHLQSPEELPEIFIREATTVQKSLIAEERFLPILASRGPVLQGFQQEDFPPLDGVVITSPKELASMLLLRPGGEQDPTQDPLLAAWTYGIGKSIAFTSDAGRRWGKAWTSWGGFQRFWGQCIRWVSRARNQDGFRVTRFVEGEKGSVTIDAIAPGGEFLDGLRFEGTVISPDLESQPITPRQVAPGRYAAEFPVNKKGTYAVVMSYEKDGRKASYVTGVSVPYSPEYRRLSTNLDLLRQLAEAGGGRFHDPAPEPSEAGFFSRDFPWQRSVQDTWRVLLTLAVVLFYADVFVRRVVVDYRKAARTAVARVAALLRGKPAAREPADERLATLLQRKAELRERTAGRFEAPRAPEPVAPGPASAAWAARAREKALPAAPGPEPTAQTAPPAEEAKPAAVPAASSYTARLLEAKRRALRRGEPGTGTGTGMDTGTPERTRDDGNH
jgi:uncharacterized membrane protein/Mg-chelatase subunit ChlD